MTVFGGNFLAGDVHSSVTMDRHLEGSFDAVAFGSVCRSLLTISYVLPQVISVIDGFTTVKAFFLFDGSFTVMLLQRSFVGEKSYTLLAFLVGSFDQTFHRLINLPHLLISRGKHGFK